MKPRFFASSALLLLHLLIAGCALINAEPPMMGKLENGIYTHPKGGFSCLVNGEFPGLSGQPKIVDASRIVKTEHIPLWQREPGDPKNTRIVSDKTVPSNTVRFEYASGVVVEFTSGTRVHSIESVLQSGMSGGFSWRFDRREIARGKGRMMTVLMLVPWHEEGSSYMGTNIAEAYRSGEGPNPALWVHSNIVIAERVHTVTIKLPAEPLLSPGVHPRDLTAVRDDLASQHAVHDKLFNRVDEWLASCHFAGDET